MKSKSYTLFYLFLVFVSTISAKNNKPDFMPIPETVKLNNERFYIDESFTVSFSDLVSERVVFNSNRFLERLAGRTGIFFTQGLLYGTEKDESPSIKIIVNEIAELKAGINESYTINVSGDKITLEAATDIGAVRGLETLLQLLSNDDKYYFTGCKIEDSPRFMWRGLLMDVARHFMPVDVIKRNLRGLAASKMNVLHLHLCDDQGFRVESRNYPLLTEKASDGKYFTQEQIKDIINYADLLGIRVVPEFDIPGHASSWITAYPALASKDQEYKLARNWGIFDPTLNPTKEYTYKFLDTLFSEMTSLFPDEYFHIGGDENNGKHWNENEDIQDFMKENSIPDNHALQAYFNQKVLEILTRYNKKMVGWDEIQHENMPRNIVIQSWRGKEGIETAAKMGFQVILSNGYYIDLIHPAEDHYLNDPLPEETNLTKEEAELVLGGEATMWAEFVSPETVDSRIWPRTGAIAERLWSKNLDNNIEDMYRRLGVFSFRLEELGLTHIKNRDMLLRRLTGNMDTEPLRILANVVEPLKNYQRGRYKNYTQQAPLTRLVDVAIPDAPDARKFNSLVSEHKSGADNKELILKWLDKWSDNHKNLLPVIENNPVLDEIVTLSYDLSYIAGETAAFIRNENRAEYNKLKDYAEKAKEQRGQNILMILNSVNELLEMYND